MLYSNFVVRFRSRIRLRIFSLCFRMTRAFFRVPASSAPFSAIWLAYPITMESGVRMS